MIYFSGVLDGVDLAGVVCLTGVLDVVDLAGVVYLSGVLDGVDFAGVVGAQNDNGKAGKLSPLLHERLTVNDA